MAKSGKSGLGRGLNSLLGGAYEEATPIEAVPKRVLVEQEQEEPIRTSQKPAEPIREPGDDQECRTAAY